MSITVHLYYTGTGGSAQRFAEEMEKSGTADAIRRETGNLRYDYFISMADPETVLLIDAWEDQAALDRHHGSPMMETITVLREKYGLHMRAERFCAEEAELPEADSRFIRE